jgi:hypothetical protein
MRCVEHEPALVFAMIQKSRDTDGTATQETTNKAGVHNEPTTR